MRAGQAIDGILLLDKPAGPSSNQALQRVKRLYGARKAGHAGTLDPLATGLLPVLLGEATKFAAYSSEAAKTYEADVLLGLRTTSGDLAGEVIERRPVAVCRHDIEAALERFRGHISQIPPMYSALKQQGEPLYRIARRGGEVSRQPRAVHIAMLSLLDFAGDRIELRIECSKGTYIRVLAEDLGAALGCGATLERLRRTGVGGFRVDAALELDTLERMSPDQRLEALLPVDAALQELPRLELPAGDATRLRQGQAVDLATARAPMASVRLYEEGPGRFLGLGQTTRGTLCALRMISDPGTADSSLPHK
jgi:tRNA pseudouridine55 synthase